MTKNRRDILAHIKVNKEKQHDSAVVVGGSLSGLMTAIALSQQGIRVTVLEKSKEGVRSGASLRVDGYSFNETEIEKMLKGLVSEGKNSVQLWSSIESRLRKNAHNDPNIVIHYCTRVLSVDQDEQSAWAETEEGKLFKGDILIGADGHRSMVRKNVAPHHSHAEFSGYVVWMASFPENELLENERPDPNGKQVKFMNTRGGYLFGSVLEIENETRRIACTWYDNTQAELLYRLGAVQGKLVHHSVQGSEIPEKDLDILADMAKINWPEPWRTATLHAILTRNFIGIPIKEYAPVKLRHGRFALVGDAAHVPAPTTTSGFNESLKDAAVLSECASEGLQGSNASDTLDKYESLRLKKVQQTVESGREFSKSFGRY